MSIKQIYASELNDFLQDGQALLLDVREPYENAEFAIPNSSLIPLGQLDDNINLLDEYRDKDIIVYCKAGIRSMYACQILENAGFKKLYNLSDGIIGYRAIYRAQ